ncbi:MAG: DNA-directed RNA polymerase core subunit rpc40 [Chrysothrix sp. TS-e1954]|nr:MAG: DNA-directed RNA polymerase core subunit rpc40 [Chrysothrix sp. TS-e1954]
MARSHSSPTRATLEARKSVNIGKERVENITSKEFPHHYPQEDHSWNIATFREKVSVKLHRNTPNDAVFSLVGVDPSFANAFRRILLSSIPHLVIHDVYIKQNTSIIQDEVLAHRLGLIPLKGRHEGIRWLQWRQRPNEEDQSPGAAATDVNAVLLKLKVKCEWEHDGKEKAKQGIDDLDQLYTKPNVYASDFVYEPVGQQSAVLPVIEPCNPDILIAKLRPDQEIDIDCHAQKGTGAEHAKYSPVCTASYRLLPTITITSPILGQDAEKFQSCFPPGVIQVGEVTKAESQKKGGPYEAKHRQKKAVVEDTFRDTVSRECLRHDEFKDKVKLGRVRDHFIFSVESVGQIDSDELFLESVRLLKQKCVRLKREIPDLRAGHEQN